MVPFSLHSNIVCSGIVFIYAHNCVLFAIKPAVNILSEQDTGMEKEWEKAAGEE